MHAPPVKCRPSSTAAAVPTTETSVLATAVAGPGGTSSLPDNAVFVYFEKVLHLSAHLFAAVSLPCCACAAATGAEAEQLAS